jgi:hypothetical protein
VSRVPLLVALAVIACQKRPVIQRFSVDEANPDARAPVHFSFSVSGATTIRIDPLPGVVAESPVTVVPIESATFTLRAFNDDGVEASASLPISVRAPFEILLAEASPGQVTPGNQVRLSWVSSSSERASLTNETTGEATDVAANGSMIVHPAATTIYTLTIFNRPGRLPASRTARMTARVAPAPSVGDFIATPAQILQGQSSTLTWKGNAVSYSVATAQGDGAPPPFFVGPQRSLVVRPQATTTYSLQAVGPLDGALPTPLTATVTVIPNPGATLAYHPPTPTAGQLLQLVADPCPAPCTTMTFHIVPSGPAVPLRGLAFNLPLDTTKVTFNRFATGARLSAADARATMGSGPLKDVLVVGIALRGSGTAPAADVSIDPLPLTPDAEVGRFVLQLVSAGGVGPVFDGSAPLATYKASIQRASGRSAGAIAVGKLEAQ